MGAEQLAGQEICMVADSLAAFHVLTAATKDSVGLFPQFLRDDGGDNLTGGILEYDPLLRGEKFLFLGEHIHDFDLIPDVVSFIFGVGDHP